MKKTGTMFIKNLRYICLVGIIALGLMTIVGTGGGGGDSGTATTTTDTTAPEDVTTLSALPGDSKATLSWTASANSESDLAGQKAYYSSDGGTTYTTAESALSTSATTCEVTGLTNGTSYMFKVTCYDEVPNESSGATVSCYANAPLSDSDFPVQSGLTDGGVASQATQRMQGTVPNPTGSSDTYGGKAYLVLNGDRIQLSVTSSSSSSGRTIYKEGKEYYLDDADVIDFSSLSKEGARADAVTWAFDVTFSIVAGLNSLFIEVYDLADALFSRTEEWTTVGTIEPTSLVVTLWWNTNLTDIDLHVSPDDGTTHCYYYNSTAGGMVLDYDDVNGYGPEHITVETVTGTKTYKIKVYYYADHNTSDTTTATTASVTAAVNGETQLSDSHLMSVASTVSTWGTGSHIWDAGEVEVSAANLYDVVLGDPVLTAFPTVQVTVTVTDPTNDDAHVSGLTSDNFYAINAGTSMSGLTVTEGSSSYTLEYTDTTCGARDLYVYVYVPAEGTTAMKGGKSNTKTYGKSYALLVGIEDYPGDGSDLNYCIDDINDMYTALTANTMWSSTNITKITESSATKSAVLDEITRIARLMEKYDVFLFHFSGHGSDGADDGSQYLCTYTDGVWISVTDLATKLSSIPDPGSNITNAFVTLDACFSGNFIGKGMGREATRRSRPFIPQRESQPSGLTNLAFSRDMRDLTGTNLFVMTAVDGAHSAWDVPSPLENGLFTYYLVEGLAYTNISDAPANSNNDVWVTGEEAYSYLMPKAKEYCEENIYDATDPDYADAEQISQYYPDLTTKSRLVYTW